MTDSVACHKPLTIEELRKIYDGEKGAIWVKFGKVVWPAIIDYYDGDLVAIWNANGHESGLWEKDYGKTWLAYRYKPSEWISVKDRLPESYVDVLVRRSTGMSVEYVEDDGVWREDHIQTHKHPVTHWMPLPEPPEVE